MVDVEFAFTEDRKLRGQLRNASAIEAQVRSRVGLAVHAGWASNPAAVRYSVVSPAFCISGHISVSMQS